MDSTQIKIPFYVKMSLILLGTLAFFYIMYIGQDIIIPIVFAVIISIVLNPFVNLMCRYGIGKVPAILIALLVSIFLLTALFYFIGSQLAGFSESFPQLKSKFAVMFKDSIDWVSQTFNISKWKINEWVNKTKGEGMKISANLIGQTLGTISGVLIIVFLLPVYIFMILYYKALLLEFISRLFKGNRHKIAEEVLFESKRLVQSYLVGLLLEALIVAILNSLCLFIIGIQYAILIGLIGALLNVIPYIGGLVAIAIPMLVAIATGEPIDALWVLMAYMLVQFIDNNFIVPKVVASKVKVNALVSIIVVIVGGALWGISGMFLSIPLIAILKVVFDRIEPLKPFGFLLGDDQPRKGSVIFRFKK